MALLGCQIVEIAKHSKFPVAWDSIGLRSIQLAIEGVVWVLDMRKIGAIPRELRHILMSYLIKKVCVGVLKDISVIWDDLRIVMNVCDSGMMARLMLADKYLKHGYSNLSLKTSVEDILGFTIDKDLALSDWSANKLSDEQITKRGTHITTFADAALDAVASLELSKSLKGPGEQEQRNQETNSGRMVNIPGVHQYTKKLVVGLPFAESMHTICVQRHRPKDFWETGVFNFRGRSTAEHSACSTSEEGPQPTRNKEHNAPVEI
ncbi:hypothetical protein B0H13DRAFT_1888922 [Mycena leptocephala]|nr:hypothetical protein B0H13DRAFT_1888922 [Mycena leptocephala]